mmetsp:Transcript_5154/g.12372  ORF Transcript_5154/g.12372 Transcript_5154/m.12372 type:complete len:85 (-) Transcript_5154:12-266(-)
MTSAVLAYDVQLPCLLRETVPACDGRGEDAGSEAAEVMGASLSMCSSASMVPETWAAPQSQAKSQDLGYLSTEVHQCPALAIFS